MATSSDFIASPANDWSLTANVFDALRDAVIVVDARDRRLPIVLANAVARRCVAGDAGSMALIGASLRASLAAAADGVLHAASEGALRGKPGVTRSLPWQLHAGQTPLDTEIKTLAGGRGQRLVMLTFAAPEGGAGPRHRLDPGPVDLSMLNDGSAVEASEVRRLNELLVETQRAAKIGRWEYRYATDEMTGTDELCRIYGADSQHFAVSWETLSARCTEESRRRLTAARAGAEAVCGSCDLELEIDTPACQRIWIRFIGHWESVDGRASRAYGSVQDINAQKLDRIALENTSGWLRLSMNMAHMHAWRWNMADDSLEFAIVDGIVHLPTALPGMKELMTRVHPRDRAGLNAAIEEAFATRTELQHQFRVKSPQGRYLTYDTVARPLFDAAHQRQGLVGVTRDVSKRCEAETRLKRSEELLRATTANTADTLLLVDSSLLVRFINRAVGERSIEDILGRRISILLPEAVRNGVLDKLRKVLRSGRATTNEFQVPAHEKTQYYEYRAVRMSADGMGAGLSITVRNVTERKRLEQEILAVSSRERHSIGRDLHDGLGQELTGIALMLRGLATRIQSRCPDAVDNVNEVVALVNQSIESARSLARGLLPVRTDNGGIAFALRTLAARSRDLYGLDVTFRCETCLEMDVSEASASHLYRIAQEALTNASRHGGADRVDIFLSVAKAQFALRISDNGCGIDERAKAAPGMGLKIMRYRAHMIGAKFGIAPLSPHGTVVSVTGEQPLVISALQSSHAI